ncbi:MAG TPA: hypothetical protein VJP77_04735 [Planctomycetota bacterium]|nr:hypothetical protein [Planctomycetota bacterium]
MKHLRIATLSLALLALPALLAACAQTPPAEQAAPEPAGERWEISSALYAFDPPDDDAYVLPIVRADRGDLHLEARYNYEGRDTGSLWIGRNFELGGELAVTLTPMLGAVLGEVGGVAPGLEVGADWRRFAFYTEAEYVFDTGGDDDDFFYMWSELSYAPTDWARVGIVGQRTRTYDQELEVDRGFVLGFGVGRVWIDFFVFNPDVDEPYVAASAGAAL